MTKILITQATIINEGTQTQADVYLKDGRIEHIGGDLQHLPVDEVIDATGLMLIPGMIDDQVHFREPGLTHKGNIATESTAAVAGGITSFMEMPNVKPPTLNLEALEDKYNRAQGRAKANFGFYMGASNDNLEDIKKLPPNAACGVKVFMGASTGNMLVDKPEILEGIFEHAPILVATHCEDTPTITKNEELYRQQYGEDVPMKYHPVIRSEEACYLSSSMAVDLAKRFGTQLHVLHLTTEKELAHFTAGAIDQKNITAEACVHHLFFNEEDYESKGALIKCNPAIKKVSDQKALLQAVVDDVIDIIATDHAPHTLEEKNNTYFSAPAGLPLVQYALVSLFEHYHNGVMSLEKIVEKTSHNVARRYQLKERGFIREGYWADLALVDISSPKLVERSDILSLCGWSPFEGHRFKSQIVTTFVNGEKVYDKGKILELAPNGQRLQYLR